MSTATFRFLAPLACAALLTACASGPRLERYMPAVAGTTYVTQMQDTGSFGSGRSEMVTRIEQRDWQGTQVNAFATPAATTLVMPTGAFVAQVAPDGKTLVTWDPPVVWDFPIEVGKSWTKQYTLKNHAQNRTIPFETKQVVEAYEDVTVAGRTYKAFRVRTSDTLGNENVQWLAPELGFFIKGSLRRTDKAAQGAGTREFELKTLTPKAAY